MTHTHSLIINQHNGQEIPEGVYLDNDAGQYKPKDLVRGYLDFIELGVRRHNIMIDAQEFIDGTWELDEPQDFVMLMQDLQDEIANTIDQASFRDKTADWSVNFDNAGIMLVREETS